MLSRKDDYAFFLTPVDATLVPGYADAIQHPMDFGTITKKVERGRYRTLEEFAVSLATPRSANSLLTQSIRMTSGL